MSGALLRSGHVKDFYPLGAVGNPVYTAASQLRAAMRRQLGQKVADLFAIPKQDEHGDGIDWYAPAAGSVVPWSSATQDERMGAIRALLLAREQVAARSAMLESAEDSEQQIFGKLLALAMQIPSDKHVYLVDGQPVITFWGFTERDAPPGYDVIASLDAGEARLPAPTVVDPEPLPLPVPLSEVTRRPSRRYPWWWWLLALLLLLALLFLGLRYCRPEAASSLGLSWFGPDESDTGAAVVPAPEDPAPGVERDRYVLDREGRWVDRETGAVAIDQEGAGGLPASGASPPETGAEVPPPETTPPTPEGEAPPKPSADKPPPEQPPEEPKPPAPDAPPEPPKPDGPQQQTPPEKPVPPEPGPQGTPPAGPAPASTPPKGAPLSIPPQAAESGSTEFLNGQWRSITGLQDRSGNPVQLQYDFKDGQGTATLKRSAAGGEQTCAAPVRPILKQGKLSIEQSSIRCPDGSVFNPSLVECAPDPTGHAICLGKNEDGSTYGVKIVKD